MVGIGINFFSVVGARVLIKSKKGTGKSSNSSKGASKKAASSTHNTSEKDPLKKAFLIGLGATVLTAGKVTDAMKELVDDLVAKGHVKPQDAKKFAEDLKGKFNQEKNQMEASL